MEEKEKVEAETSSEERELTAEEEEAGELHWKTKPDRVWIQDEAVDAGEEKVIDPEAAAREEEELRQLLEETRRKAEEIPEEELHPSYKRLVGGMAGTEVMEREEDGKKVRLGKCDDCGAMVPVDQLQDNGSFLACPKCY